MKDEHTKQGPTRLPGDLLWRDEIARMLRVDHAGEYGAARIYDGQLAVLGDRHPAAPTIRHMREQEVRHLQAFDALLNERRVRPTLLGPIWHIAGFGLGAATALMGEKAAMACTQAVEEVIEQHYDQQIDVLKDSEPELAQMITEFRDDEIEHKEIAKDQGAEETPGYALLSGAIKAGCHAAIWLSKRI